MSTSNWRNAAKRELVNGEAAHRAGNEGRARVCARRAAGLAARDFLDRHLSGSWRPAPASTGDAYTALRLLSEFPGLSPELRSAAAHLTLRVTEEFKLPVDADLLAEARLLCERLGEIQ